MKYTVDIENKQITIHANQILFKDVKQLLDIFEYSSHKDFMKTWTIVCETRKEKIENFLSDDTTN
jgi:neutral trehalase